jgi:hypothetical protein
LERDAVEYWSALVYYREAYGAERAAQASDDQLRGVYEIYRTFGGEDLPAERAARDYRNSFQYAAIVDSKGALMFDALEKATRDNGNRFSRLGKFFWRQMTRIR